MVSIVEDPVSGDERLYRPGSMLVVTADHFRWVPTYERVHGSRAVSWFGVTIGVVPMSRLTISAYGYH